jgi:CRISPR/Cas system CMR-associated protein Cmr5 small subunit
MTTNEITTNDQIRFIEKTATNHINKAIEEHASALARLATFTDSHRIEQLMNAAAELQVWTLINNYLVNMRSEGLDDATIQQRLEREAARYALSTHKINSTSNVSVEMETITRLTWVEAYNLICTGSIWR